MSREAAARSPRERAEKRVGATLVKWRLDALIGIGGMAAVYAATHAKNRSRVALKVLHRELGASGDIRERFLREAYVANSVGHPGAVQILDDYVSEDDEPFLVMELLLGSSLDAVQSARGKLPPADVLAYTNQILDVLAAAHDKGIVHRDIKPQNIFVTRDGRIKMLDFGVARLLDGAASATVTGSLLGTPAFMPPEQASGRTSAVGAASDLWSVGATMFTLLTGRFVHEAENAQAHTVKAAVMHARSLRELMPDAPSALVDVVDRALKFEITDRWPDAQTMRAAVQRAAARPAPSPTAAKIDEEEGAKTHLAPLADRQPHALPGVAQLPLLGDDADEDDEETHAMARGDLRAMMRPRRGDDASGDAGSTAPNAAEPRQAVSKKQAFEPSAAEPSIDDGATTSVVALQRAPAAIAQAAAASDVATSVVVVPPPAFTEARNARPDLPVPPPPVASAEAVNASSVGRTAPLPPNMVALAAAWKNASEGATTTAPFPQSPGTAPAKQSYPGSVALVPPPPPSNPGGAPARQSFPSSVALVPPPSSSGVSGAPQFNLPPPPPPEATSVSAQSISQATSPERRKKGLGTPEILAITGGVLAIIVVLFVVLRALLGGDSEGSNNAAPGDTGTLSGPAPSMTTLPDAPSAAVTASATASETTTSSEAVNEPAPTATAAPSAKPTYRGPVNPGGARWKPNKHQ